MLNQIRRFFFQVPHALLSGIAPFPPLIGQNINCGHQLYCLADMNDWSMFDESFGAFREQLIKQRTQGINMIRVHCTEFSVVCPKDVRKIAELEQVIVDDDDIGLPQPVKELSVVMGVHLSTIRCELECNERKIQLLFKQNETCQRLTEIPGIVF